MKNIEKKYKTCFKEKNFSMLNIFLFLTQTRRCLEEIKNVWFGASFGTGRVKYICKSWFTFIFLNCPSISQGIFACWSFHTFRQIYIYSTLPFILGQRRTQYPTLRQIYIYLHFPSSWGRCGNPLLDFQREGERTGKSLKIKEIQGYPIWKCNAFHQFLFDLYFGHNIWDKQQYITGKYIVLPAVYRAGLQSHATSPGSPKQCARDSVKPYNEKTIYWTTWLKKTLANVRKK